MTFEQGERFAKQNGIDYFIEASAKTNLNVEKLFLMASKMLYKKHYNRIL